MKNILRVATLVFILSGFANLHAQPGCPEVTTTTNVNIPCGQHCTTLTATAFSGAQTTSYTVAPITYAPPFAFNSGTNVLVHTDDLWSAAITLPFSFCFYGNSFTSAIIGSNGCISFNTQNAGLFNDWSIPGPIPFTGETDMRNSIMAPWQDLDPTNKGDIYYNVGGTAPCRYLEVSWYHCPMYGDPNSVNTSFCTTAYQQTQMAVIYETSMAIEIYIQQKGTPCTAWNNGWAVEGIMNGTGTAALAVTGRNATVWGPVTNDAYRFTPAGAPNYTIAWFNAGGTQIGSSDTITVCPPAGSTMYTAKATYTNCDNSTVTVSANVFVGLSNLTVADSVRPITCNNAANGAVFATYNTTSGIISYGWSPGGAGQTSLNNIGPGTYIFTAEDSLGCTVRDTETLTNPPVLTLHVNNDTVASCSGNTNTGSLLAVAGGGTPGYTYRWIGGSTANPLTGLSVGTYSVKVTDSHGCTDTASGSVVVTSSALTFNSPQITNVSCFGGTNGQIIASLNGGTAPITYSWSAGTSTSDTLSNQPQGTYTVTATDAHGCSSTASYTIGQPTQLVVTVGNDTVSSCNSSTTAGTLNASVSGGTTGYTYSWTGGETTNPATGLNAGTYTVTVTDAHSCTATASASVVVVVNPISFGTPQVTNVSCLGGTNGQIIANVIGGTLPITFSWSQGNSHTDTLSNVGAGVYTVTATATGGCTASASYTIDQPSTGVSVTVANDTVTSCTGTTNIGTLLANVTGGTPSYTYSWSNTQTTNPIDSLVAGTYTVTVHDVFGCSATASGTVVTKVSSLGITGAISNPICFGLKGQIIVTVTGATQPITYSWNPGNSTTDSLIGIGGGTYNVTATDANGCTVSASFTVNQPTALNVTVPNDTVVSCSGIVTTGTLTATGSGGTPGYTYSWTNNSTGSNISGLGSGTYCVTITDNATCTASSCGSVDIVNNPIVFNTPQITNATCASGSTGQIILSTTGGTAPITFSWSGGTTQNDTLRDLAPGTYNITATDVNGCSATVSYVINQPSPIVFGTPVITNVGCSGGNTGSISVNTTGGTGTVTYSWSNGDTGASITGLTAGGYIVTATDGNGCTATALYTVDQSAPIVIGNATVDGTSCTTNDGTISVTATGGSGTLTYTWNPGGLHGSSITGLGAGGYTLTVTDTSGCSATAYYIVGHTNCGCPEVIPANNNVAIPCSQTCTSLSASVFSAAQTTAYTASSIPYAPPFSFVGGTVIINHTDDLWSGVITLPFTFCYWGVAHNQIVVGSNGEISFNVANAGAFNNWSIPGPLPNTTQNDQKNVIMCPWQDMDPTYHGTIYYNITGTAPCRKFEVSWDNCPMFGDSGSVDNGYCSTTAHQTQMCVLYETTNAIDIYIQQKIVSCTNLSGGVYWNGGNAIEAIVGPVAADWVAVPGRNSGQWTATNDAWRFTPSGAPNYTVSWYQGGNLIANTDTVVVCPTVATTYTVQATYTDCANNQVVVEDSVYVTPGGSLTVTVDSVHNILCNGDSDGAVYASYTDTGTITSFGWSPGGANLTSLVGIPAGTYIFTVTTSTGCSKSDTVVLVNPAPVVVTVANDTFNSCSVNNIGTLHAGVSGGTPGYTYAWSNGATTDTISGLTPGTYRVTVTDSHGCTGSAVATVVQLSGSLTFTTPQVTNATCTVGGSIIVGVTGGALPITYSWSPTEPNTDTLSGLPAGTYSVTATDAGGCTASASFTITAPVGVTIHGTVVNNVTCNGAGNGSIIVHATAGNPPLTYSWSPVQSTSDTLSNLVPGTYCVTVTDSAGCSATACYNITQPTPIANQSVSIDSFTCSAGGSVSIIDTGGVGTLTYSWSNNQSGDSIGNLQAGTYTVTVTDAHGCTITASYVVPSASGVVAFGPDTIVNTSCHGDSTGSITVTATGGSGTITFEWNNGDSTATITGLAAGTYSVTATDTTGCSASASYTVTQPVAITFGNAIIDSATCNGGNTGSIIVSTSGGTGHITYSWSNNETGDTITGLTSGVYCVTATDSVGCSASICYNVAQPSAIVIGNPVITAITCLASGKIIITPTGGTPGYSYSWSNGGSTGDSTVVTSAGTVTVTVTDAHGCSVTASYIVVGGVGSVMIDSATVTNISCNGGGNGSIIVFASDSVGGPITYSWSNHATSDTIAGLAVGNYCVTATDSAGCSVSACYNITQPAVITFGAPVIVEPICNGNNNGSITVNATGGTGTITYAWAGPVLGATDTALEAGTYTVTATDSAGCTATASYTLNQPAPVTITSTVDSITCNGAGNGSITVTGNGGNGGFTYSWGNGSTTASITGLGPNTYCVTVTDSLGCSASMCFTLTQPAVLAINNDVITPVTCARGGSVVITVGGGTTPYSYSWSSGTPSGDSVTALTGGNVTVTVTDHNGCTTTATYNVPTIANTVAIDSDHITNELCNGGNTGAITVYASGGSGTLTYSWTPSEGNHSAITGLTQGNYTVTVTDSLGCTATATYTITQPSAIVIDSVVMTQVTCVNQGSLDVYPSGGTPGYTYSWTGGGLTDSIGGLNAGTYTVTITDANGCTATASGTVTTAPNSIAIAFDSVEPTCFGLSNGSLTADVTGGTPGYTYSWTGGSTTSTITGLAAGTYCVTVHDAAGCSQNACYTLGQPTQLAIVNFTNIQASCNTLGSMLVNATGGTTPYSYSWTSGQTTQIVTGLIGGSIDDVTVTDHNGCSISGADTLLPAPAPLTITDSTITANVCYAGSAGSISITVAGGQGGYTYLWSPGGETSDPITGLVSGTYHVTVNGTGGCVLTDSFTVTQPGPYHATVTAAPAVCPGACDTASVTVNGGTPGYTYSWSNNGNAQLNTYCGLTTTPIVASVTVTDSHDCTVTASQTISAAQQITDTAEVVPHPCAGGGSVDVVATGGAGALTYDYTPGGSATSSGNFGNLGSGSYTYVIFDTLGCSVTGSFIVPPSSPADVDSIFSDSTSCYGFSDGSITVIEDSTQNAPFAYSINGGPFGNSNVFDSLSVGTYQVIVHNTHGCADTLSATVGQPDQMTLTFSPDTIQGFANTPVVLTPNINHAVNPVYTWTPTTGLSCANCGLDSATITAPMWYYLTVSDSANPQCRVTDSVLILLQGPIIMPNAFSPNGSNPSDDFFGPVSVDYVIVKEFHIYNRWGQLVHNSTDPWDGKFEGKPQPSGTYIYYIVGQYEDPNNPGHYITGKQEGAVTLLR